MMYTVPFDMLVQFIFSVYFSFIVYDCYSRCMLLCNVMIQALAVLAPGLYFVFLFTVVYLFAGIRQRVVESLQVFALHN